MVQTGDDMAFIDRLHFYLPGWEIPKMRNDLFTDHYGFVVDYLSRIAQVDQRTAFPDQCLHSAETNVRQNAAWAVGIYNLYALPDGTSRRFR